MLINQGFNKLLLKLLTFLASSNNNAQKFSYLDGVPFAINPIFLNDSQVNVLASTLYNNSNLMTH